MAWYRVNFVHIHTVYVIKLFRFYFLNHRLHRMHRNGKQYWIEIVTSCISHRVNIIVHCLCIVHLLSHLYCLLIISRHRKVGRIELTSYSNRGSYRWCGHWNVDNIDQQWSKLSELDMKYNKSSLFSLVKYRLVLYLYMY